MSPMSRHQLRAARALVLLRQEALADLAGVGVATIRRFENGSDISRENLAALRAAIEAEGAVLVDAGIVEGRQVGLGVFLPPTADLPASTRVRLEALDMTPEQAAVDLPPERADKVGRRSRIPYRRQVKGTC